MKLLSKPEALAVLDHYRRALLTSEIHCVMCALATQTERHDVIFENDVCRVVLDRLGARRGHLLVIPTAHVESFSKLDWSEYRSIQKAVFEAARAVEAALRPRRVFVASTGASEELPMSYPHFHIHVIPVYEADERARPARVLSWSEGVVAYDDDEARALCARLRKSWLEQEASCAIATH